MGIENFATLQPQIINKQEQEQVREPKVTNLDKIECLSMFSNLFSVKDQSSHRFKNSHILNNYRNEILAIIKLSLVILAEQLLCQITSLYN